MTARVYRDDPGDVASLRVHPVVRVEEQAEIVAVRGLLCELRPASAATPRGCSPGRR
ncbi:MAG: hypothetical protein R3A48_28715 [Polyangiales bacterium]